MSSERRAALAEINGRRVNEAIERGHRDELAATFVCECGHLGCSTRLSLSIADYERVRSAFDRFVIAEGHELPEIEDVVERGDGWLVVRKHAQEAALAPTTDERTTGDDDQ